MSEACCPLVNFYLDNDVLNDSNEFIIKNKNLKIITNNDKIVFTKKTLSNLSQKELKDLPYYWIYVSADDDFCRLTNYIHLFQLSLLIVKPTALKIYYKYNMENLIRFEDIFKFVKEPNDNFGINDLKLVRKYYPIMLEIFKNKKRLRSALVSMLNGCTTIHWDAAYILYVTTYEALLTEGSKFGIKKKLATSYAILTETKNKKRQLAFENFRDIYQIRSKILHGKSFKDEFGKGEINLERLADCRDMLRKLWQVILDSEEIRDNLSGKDGDRRKYFKKIADGWIPEEENGKI